MSDNGVPTPIPVENEPVPEGVALVRQFVRQLDALIARLRALRPAFRVPPLEQSPWARSLMANVDRFVPAPDPDSVLGQLRTAVMTEGLDQEALQGLWFMAQYTVQMQADLVRRRFTGDFETDPYGLDWEFLEAVRPFLAFLYQRYWRVETTGLEHVPDYGRALLVANHSGQLPFDGAMVGAAVLLEHPAQRLVRPLYSRWFSAAPFASILVEKSGGVLGNDENARRLLEADELVAVFPEGHQGLGKAFRERYRLARFARGGFARAALTTGAPLIPVAIVGAEETYVSLGRSALLARLSGLPYYPITLRWPWLGPLGLIPLPTRWSIDFGPPLPVDGHAPGAERDPVLIAELTDQVRGTVQRMLHHRLARRKHLFRSQGESDAAGSDE